MLLYQISFYDILICVSNVNLIIGHLGIVTVRTIYVIFRYEQKWLKDQDNYAEEKKFCRSHPFSSMPTKSHKIQHYLFTISFRDIYSSFISYNIIYLFNLVVCGFWWRWWRKQGVFLGRDLLFIWYVLKVFVDIC